MFCKTCGTQLEDTAAVCENCGTVVENPEVVNAVPVAPAAPAAPAAPVAPAAPTAPVAPQQTVVYAAPVVTNEIPEENRPLSPWAYFGLQLLFAIPIVGFIFLIVFSCNGSNINRRNFARSYWCGLIIVAIAAAVVFGIAFIMALAAGGSRYGYY